MNRIGLGFSLALVALIFLWSPALAESPPQASRVLSVADQAFLASLATSRGTPAAAHAAKRPRSGSGTGWEKAQCSASATCRDGSTVSCEGNNSTASCTGVDSQCPWGEQGHVTCDGVTTCVPLVLSTVPWPRRTVPGDAIPARPSSRATRAARAAIAVGAPALRRLEPRLDGSRLAGGSRYWNLQKGDSYEEDGLGVLHGPGSTRLPGVSSSGRDGVIDSERCGSGLSGFPRCTGADARGEATGESGEGPLQRPGDLLGRQRHQLPGQQQHNQLLGHGQQLFSGPAGECHLRR
jgi:hypothetical protein